MEAILSQPIETRVALVEASLEERKHDIADIKGKVDRLFWGALAGAVLLLADILYEKVGLITLLHR